MQFYNRFGFEWFSKDSGRRVGWWRNGEFFDEDYWSRKIARALRSNAEFHRVISPAVKIISDLGFEHMTFIDCKCRSIIVGHISPYCEHEALLTIEDAYDLFLGANPLGSVINLCDANIDIDIYDNIRSAHSGRFNPEGYKKKYFEYVRSVPRLRNLHAGYIATFAALLPQPIAEEIAAEFKLVRPHSK